MISKTHSIAVAACCLMLAATPAVGQDYFSVGGGAFNINRDNHATEFQLEYQGNEWGYNFSPIVGINATTDGSFYGYAGLNYYLEIGGGFYLLPSFAAGIYEEGDGIDLGGPLEFRSSIEGGYTFSNSHRLSAALRHLSNASIYDRNPGEESVVVLYSIPVSSLLGGLTRRD